MEQIRRSKRTAWRRVDDEVIVVSSDTNALTILNDTAGRVWELLDAPKTEEELAAALAEEYEVEADAARKDVAALLEDLRKSHLLATKDEV